MNNTDCIIICMSGTGYLKSITGCVIVNIYFHEQCYVFPCIKMFVYVCPCIKMFDVCMSVY